MKRIAAEIAILSLIWSVGLTISFLLMNFAGGVLRGMIGIAAIISLARASAVIHRIIELY
jgi:hypothetical protein